MGTPQLERRSSKKQVLRVNTCRGQTRQTDITGKIATPWSAKQGVIAKDAGGPYNGNPKLYVEQTLKHRTDDKCGYDAIYTPGSKCWKFTKSRQLNT